MTLKPVQFYFLSVFNLLLLFIGIFDISHNNQQLSNFLIKDINPNIYFILIGFPHVFASFLTLFHQGYYNHYKSYLCRVVAPILALVFCLYLIDIRLYKILFCYLLAAHIGGQLMGTIKIYANHIPKGFRIWKKINVLILFFSFLTMFAKDALIFISGGIAVIHNVLLIMGLLSLVCAIVLLFLPENKKVIYFLLLILTQILGITYFSLNDNLLYWGLSITILHDVTAFIFYIHHEKNTLNKKIKNLILPEKINSTLGLLGFSVLISVFFTSSLSYLSIPHAMFLFQVFHYLLEGNIWKSGSLHRQNIMSANS